MSQGNANMWWRQSFSQRPDGRRRRIVVVSDVDGILPEAGTRGLPHAQAAVDFLAAHGIPLVINSSRTRAEVERLHHTLHVRAPFITEYGAALFMPHGSFPVLPPRTHPAVGGDVIDFGGRYHDVVDTLKIACRESGVRVVGLAELSIDEAARELGVALAEAQLAKLREYSELFRIVDDRDSVRSRLFKFLRRRGLRTWRAGNHHLVTAAADRSESLRTLRAIWRHSCDDPLMIGLGNSDDDVVWLQHLDVAVIVENEAAGVPARLLAKLPTAHVTRRSGTRGWSEAIFEHVGALLSSNGVRTEV